jgi:DNA-binding transcriptional MerR regulator
MRIGELAKRTGTSRRLLRYYEEHGLLEPERTANGYREYDERFIPRVAQIRGLLDAGLPIRIIQQLLPCLDTPWTIYCPDPTPEMMALLERERDRMTERIGCLVRNRDAIVEYLAAARAGGHDSEPREDVGSRPRVEVV